MMTVLMVLDAIISIALILVILGQEAKSGGMVRGVIQVGQGGIGIQSAGV